MAVLYLARSNFRQTTRHPRRGSCRRWNAGGVAMVGQGKGAGTDPGHGAKPFEVGGRARAIGLDFVDHNGRPAVGAAEFLPINPFAQVLVVIVGPALASRPGNNW